MTTVVVAVAEVVDEMTIVRAQIIMIIVKKAVVVKAIVMKNQTMRITAIVDKTTVTLDVIATATVQHNQMRPLVTVRQTK